MSITNITIGEAELEIMKVIWNAKGPISSTEVGRIVEERGWKRTTIATFLARLVEKGALAAEKQGKTMFYTPLITAGDYKKSQVKHLIHHLFNGSAHELVASLFEDDALSEEDISELKSIFDDK